jgi:hypothetical protein
MKHCTCKDWVVACRDGGLNSFVKDGNLVYGYEWDLKIKLNYVLLVVVN